MKIIRFRHRGKPEYGLIDNERIRIIDGSIFEDRIRPGSVSIGMAGVKPLAPVEPTKVVCVGLNYKDHARELKTGLPEEPVLFLKPSTSVIGPDDDIIYPRRVNRLDYEAELAVVIRRRAKDVLRDEAYNYILGYSCLNDITARDLQKKDGQWTRAKSFDTFCPLGPYIVTGLDPHRLKIELLVNNQIRQSSSTSSLIFRIEFLVSFISGIMTLLPGDVIATGTPSGIGALSQGDEVEVKIKGIGSLKNKVVAQHPDGI